MARVWHNSLVVHSGLWVQKRLCLNTCIATVISIVSQTPALLGGILTYGL